MTVYLWIKYRTMHSSGPGLWAYQEVSLNEDTPTERREALEDELASLEYELSTQSEHWRGIEADYEDPPISYLEDQLTQTQKIINTMIESRYRWTGQIIKRGTRQ